MPDFERTHTVEDVVAVTETDRAVLCLAQEFEEATGERKMWVPKSQIDEESAVKEEGDEGHLIVNRWWAEQVHLVG